MLIGRTQQVQATLGREYVAVVTEHGPQTAAQGRLSELGHLTLDRLQGKPGGLVEAPGIRRGCYDRDVTLADRLARRRDGLPFRIRIGQTRYLAREPEPRSGEPQIRLAEAAR